MAWLTGKKTYIVSIVAIISAWVGVWAGTVDFATALLMTQTAITGSTLRSGVASIAK